MSLNMLKEHIKNKNFGGVYLFFGEEEYLKSYYLKAFSDALLCGEEEFNLIKFDEKSYNFEELFDALESYPVMSEKKMVLLKDLPSKAVKSDIERIKKLFLDLGDYVCVVFLYTQEFDIKKSKDILKLLKEIKSVEVEFKSPGKGDLELWVKRHFASNGKDIDLQTLKYMLLVCDNSMTNLKNEIDKICSYVSVKKVEKAHIDKIASKTLDARVYNLAGSLFEGRAKQAFIVLRDLLKIGEEPVMILAVLSNTIFNTIKVKSAIQCNIAPEKAQRELDINQYAMRNLYSYARKFSWETLYSAAKKCEEADIELKSGKIRKENVMEILLCEILNETEGTIDA